jgi:beta-N-acetylhexosaminidase
VGTRTKEKSNAIVTFHGAFDEFESKLAPGAGKIIFEVLRRLGAAAGRRLQDRRRPPRDRDAARGDRVPALERIAGLIEEDEVEVEAHPERVDAATARNQEAGAGPLAAEQRQAESSGAHGRRDGIGAPGDRGGRKAAQPPRRKLGVALRHPGDVTPAPRSAPRRWDDHARVTEPAYVYQRRRFAAVAAALVVVIAAVLGVRGCSDREDEPEPAPDPLDRVSAEQLAGQRVMVRMGAKATPKLVRAARRGTIGGVILFPPSGAAPAEIAAEVERLQRAAAKGQNPPLLVAVDQEGGEVKRFADAPPQRSPSQLGARGDAAGSEAEGADTGDFLTGLGVNVDLAPVLDVPAPDSFIASRAFSDDASVVSEVGVAFAGGLEDAGLAATAKHFPGLGLATVNTDLAPSTIEASRSQLRAGMEPFEAAIANGIGLVMVSNATYPALDPEAPAGLSPRVVERELRERLGFGGVVITDDLEAPSIAAALAPPEAGVDAARAGADVLLFATGAAPGPIQDALIRALHRGLLDRGAMEESYARITKLKAAVSGGR